MSIKNIILLSFLLLISGVDPACAQKIMSINYPPDRIVMDFDLLGVVLFLQEDSADNLKIKINDRKTAIAVNRERIYQCFTIKIEPGMNTIEIVAMKNNIQVDTVMFSVYRRSDLMGEYRNPPPGYKKDHFHMKEHNECIRCHSLKSTEADRKPEDLDAVRETAAGEVFMKDISTCYSCHKSITAYPYVHGPVSVWSCLSCHEPASDPLYSVKKPDVEVCYGCHTEQKKEWTTKKYVHGPVTLGKCTICHSPHASDYPFNLYMATWNLCVNCHADKAAGNHVLSDDFSSDGHPTHNKMDPLKPGEELTCASCHNPHASDSPNLWAFDVHDIFHLCLKCHTDK